MALNVDQASRRPEVLFFAPRQDGVHGDSAAAQYRNRACRFIGRPKSAKHSGLPAVRGGVLIGDYVSCGVVRFNRFRIRIRLHRFIPLIGGCVPPRVLA